MKYYHVIIEKSMRFGNAEEMKDTRREIICPGKVRCPKGYKIIGVCGYHEEPSKVKEDREQ